MDRASRELVNALAHSYGTYMNEAAAWGSRCQRGIKDINRWTASGAVRVATPADAKRELFFVVYAAREAARYAIRALDTETRMKEVLNV